MKINFFLNGKKVQEEIAPDLLLLDLLRQKGCYSVKRGCETANCGLCTVLMDEKPVLSCSMLAARADGKKIVTLEGMQEEYERQGFDPAMIHVISGKREDQETITGNKHYDTGYGLTRKYFKKREDILKKKEETNAELENITALVGTNDFVANGIMDAITSLGYRIPEDFSVCGFDNTLVASFSGISLTTIDHCIGEKGAYAVSMLRNQRTRMEQKDDKKEKKRPIMRL